MRRLQDGGAQKITFRLGGFFCLCLCLSAAARGEVRPRVSTTDARPAEMLSFSLAGSALRRPAPRTGPPASDPSGPGLKLNLQASPAAKPATFPRRPWRAAGLVLGINLGVWAYDYHVLDEDYAYVSPSTIRYNLGHWETWDADGFKTNFFAHPYHGSLYYNSARANGLGFWPAALATFGGSLMWELCLERLPPNATDLVNTTMGGWFLGEVAHRFSSLILDDSARGFERAWREALGMLINPVRGFNRLLDGDMKGESSSPSRLSAPFSGVAMFSDGAVSQTASLAGYKSSPMLSFACEYGDPHAADTSRRPFDYFIFDVATRYTNRTAYFSIYANGLFLGHNLVSSAGHDLVLGLFQDFDFLNNEAIYLGGSSLCGGLRSRLRLSRASRLTTMLVAGWLMVGASNNEFIELDNEEYNFGTGLTAKLDTLADFDRFGSVLLQWAQVQLWGLSGIRVTDRLGILRGRYMLPVWRGLGLGVEYTHYRRNSRLDGYPDVRKRLHEIRTSVAYGF